MTGMFESFTGWMYKHSSTITTATSIVGLVSTVVLAVRATPKAHDILEEAKDRLERLNPDCKKAKRIKKEAIVDASKCYISTAITGTLTIASIVIGKKCTFSVGKQAGLGIGTMMANKMMLDYRDIVREEVGEKREREFHEKYLEREYQERGASKQTVILNGAANGYLFWDRATNVKFRADYMQVRNGILNFNNKLRDDLRLTVADLYSEIGVPYTYAQEVLYWDIDDLPNRKIEEYYDDGHDEDTHEPMCIIDYYVHPKGCDKDPKMWR